MFTCNGLVSHSDDIFNFISAVHSHCGLDISGCRTFTVKMLEIHAVIAVGTSQGRMDSKSDIKKMCER